jgi:hypothetical protein
MMHRQLAAHMDTFDSDDDFSESPSLLEEEEEIAAVPSVTVALQAAALRKRGRFRIKSTSARKAIVKFFFLCPIVIALGDYIGLVASLLLTSTAMLYLQMEPDRREEVVKEPIQPPMSPNPRSLRGQRRRSSLGGQGRHRMSSYDIEPYTGVQQRRRSSLGQGSKQAEMETFNRQQYSDCRIRVTQFLGLVGAPPLRRVSMSQNQGGGTANAVGGRPIRISERATRSIYFFAQAQSEFLLVLDQAYNWMQVSSSLHLGLGPQSQCVERVERSALAKEYRETNGNSALQLSLPPEDDHQRTMGLQQSQQQSLQQQSQNLRLEPQQNKGKSNVLALALVRTAVAQIIADMDHSLNRVLAVCEAEQKQYSLPPTPLLSRSFVNEDATTFSPGASSRTGEGSNHQDLLEVPDIISLTWIKSSRHRLVIKFRQILHTMCSVHKLQLLSSEDPLSGRVELEESMWCAREAKEYLVANLLLDNTTVNTDTNERTPAIIEKPATHDPLMQSMLQYREHLDALHGAIWACRHYITPLSSRRTTGRRFGSQSEHDDTEEDDESTESQKERKEKLSVDRTQWWCQVRTLSTALRVIEQNINDNLFRSNEEAQDDGSVLDPGSVDMSLSELLGDDDNPEQYEHVGSKVPADASRDVTIVNTLVFAGQGAVSDRPKNNPKEGKGGKSAAGAVPPWDKLAQSLLAQELQTRIGTMTTPTELEVSTPRSGTAPTSWSGLAVAAKVASSTSNQEPITSPSDTEPPSWSGVAAASTAASLTSEQEPTTSPRGAVPTSWSGLAAAATAAALTSKQEPTTSRCVAAPKSWSGLAEATKAASLSSTQEPTASRSDGAPKSWSGLAKRATAASLASSPEPAKSQGGAPSTPWSVLAASTTSASLASSQEPTASPSDRVPPSWSGLAAAATEASLTSNQELATSQGGEAPKSWSGLAAAAKSSAKASVLPSNQEPVTSRNDTAPKSWSGLAKSATAASSRSNREPASSLFFGATGSLLADLKNALPPTSGAEEELET